MPLTSILSSHTTSTVDPRHVASNDRGAPPPRPPQPPLQTRAAFAAGLLQRVRPAPVYRPRASIKRHRAPMPPQASAGQTPLAAPATPIDPPQQKDAARLRVLETSPEQVRSLRQRIADAMPRPLRRACAAIAGAFRSVVWTLGAPLRA